MSKYKYKLYNAQFNDDELKVIKEVFNTGILTHGDYVEKFEKQFAKYVGCEFAVAVNSCTSALYLCLEYLKTKNKIIQYETLNLSGVNAVQIPSVNFVSVANAIKQAGLKVDFSDDIFVGNWYYLNGTNIIDSAHYLQKNCYINNSLMCFSFYPIKQLGGAEGGIIATNDGWAAKWLRKARNHGMERKSIFDWDFSVEFAGWKMNMTNVQAAILLARLNKLDLANARRKTVRDCYNAAFELDNKSLHLYPIFIKKRNQFIKKMETLGIQCSVHFKPIHWQLAYRKEQQLSYSDWWGEHEVSIPFHDNLSHKQIEYLIDIIKKNATFVKYA